MDKKEQIEEEEEFIEEPKPVRRPRKAKRRVEFEEEQSAGIPGWVIGAGAFALGYYLFKGDSKEASTPAPKQEEKQ